MFHIVNYFEFIPVDLDCQIC